MERIIGKKCKKTNIIYGLQNCLLTLDSFGFFSDILVYRSSVSTCWHFGITGVLTLRLNHLNSLLYYMDTYHYRVLSEFKTMETWNLFSCDIKI